MPAGGKTKLRTPAWALLSQHFFGGGLGGRGVGFWVWGKVGGRGGYAILAIDVFFLLLHVLEFAHQLVDVGVGALVVGLVGDFGGVADGGGGADEVGLWVRGVGGDAFEGGGGGVEAPGRRDWGA